MASASTGTTSGGTRGKTRVEYSITTGGGPSSYDQAILYISTYNRVDKLGINYINIVTNNGGGITGASTKATSAYSASYTRTYGPNSIINISGRFYVTCTYFGSFTKNVAKAI